MLQDLALPARDTAAVAEHTIDPPTTIDHEATRARAQLYRLLSGVFIEEAGATFIDALRTPQALQDLVEMGAAFDRDFLDTPTEALQESLSLEFSQLFVVSGSFPPIESARLAGRLLQEPHFKVKTTYARLGFRMVRGKFHVFEDQLGVELLFVADMLERICDALDEDDKARARTLDKEIKRFWSLHLGKWVRGYARLIARAAEHSFYREMAALLADFADDEIARMRLRIPDEDQGRLKVPKVDPRIEINPDEPVCGACPGADRLADLRISA